MYKYKQKRSPKTRGFSLVELSIVIVIIGFLIAGIAAGTNMIKQAQLRSVITDYYSYASAYNNFLGKFNAVPGDFSNAFAFFSTNCSTTDTPCNGNSNGIIDYDSTTAADNEVNAAWVHLSQAGMIGFGAANLGAGTIVSEVGVSAPSSKVAGAGYYMVGGTNAAPFDGASNAVFIGKPTSGGTLLNSALKTADAFSIDQKMDDAAVNSSGEFIGAITGNVRAADGDEATANDCVTSGNYNIPITTVSCRLGLLLNS